MMHLSKKTLHGIKITFHVTFITIITFQLLREALYSIPNDLLFFLTSDGLEKFVSAAIVYALYYYVFKLKPLWKKVSFVLGFVIILAALAALKDYRIHDRIEFDQSFEYFTSYLGKTFLFYLGVYFMNRLDYFNRYNRLEKELIQAKEQLLKNQLHPHFLFNAFNSLYSLSLNNHPETPDYILKLSSMMRYLTDDTQLNKVQLTKEIDFIEKYIAIEKIRFGADAQITFTIQQAITDDILIEPFLLITLVENAFKHGFYTNSKDAFVTIDLDIRENQLQFTVENSIFKKQHFQKSEREGTGLKNLKQRLDLLYPRNSNLVIENNEKAFLTHLKITLN